MISRTKHERGIALMLVLSSLLVISTVVVEFAYNAHISYEVAATQRDRLKAEYLALSAVNLTRLAIRSERQLRARFAGLLNQLTNSGVTSDPFCKTFPISTGLIQGMGVISGLAAGVEEGEEEETKEAENEEARKETDEAGEGETADTLDLGGDFEASCDTEERKINLNAFAQASSPAEGGSARSQAVYEEQKNLLYSLLSQKEFEKLFEGSRDDIRKLVGAIADWADPDDRINEAPGLAGGYEESLYGDLPYKPKNGRFASVEELFLIPGVGDELFHLLEPHVTVYGDDKVNLCQGDEKLVRAFLVQYSQTPGVTPLNPDDERTMGSVLEAIRQACSQPNPQPMQVAQAITSILGGSTGSVGGRRPARPRGETQQPQGETTEAGTPPASQGATGLVSRISTQNRFYRIQGIGQAGETEVTVSLVVDTQTVDPNLWKTLYYRVQ